MAASHPVYYTFAEYLVINEASTVKLEYADGRIYAMAGGTPDHASLAAAVIGELSAALRGGRCRVYSSDLMVRVPATGLATYPDVSVVCGPRELDPESKNAVTNPALLVEVTSKSTEEYDRGEKFEHYAQIPSLREYVLVSYREAAIEVRRRDPSGRWTVHVARAKERATLTSVPCVLDVGAIYEASSDPKS